jgi:predicted unusual protein kinase regulating ubiquinone biosynthesis (AarF/ABC1/UbiB family)
VGTGERGATDDERMTRLADRYAEVLGDMKGAVMKAGQILSFIDAEGLVPGELQQIFQGALGRLQDDVPPMAEDDARAVFEQEIGRPPEGVLAFFSPRPIAAASIGQVHAAQLADGTQLAVKIQYPGAAAAVEADLANTELLTTLIRTGLSVLGARAPKVDPAAIVEEVRDRIVEELDYRTEAANLAEFGAIYEGHPFIRIPGVHPDLSGRRVLTMTMVDGRRWPAAIDSDPELRRRWGEVVYRFVFGTLHRHGLFNGDPHPGNYLFHEDGTVTFLDFGCVKRFTPERVAGLGDLVEATMAGDPQRMVRVFADLGLLPPGELARVDPDRLLAYYRLQSRALVAPQPFTYTPRYAAEAVASTYDVTGPWSDVNRHLTMPKDLVFLNRVLVGLLSILGHLGASADWVAVDAELRKGGPPATALGELDAAWAARQARPTAGS